MTEQAQAISAVRRQVRELVDGTLEVKLHVDPEYRKVFHDLFPDIDMPVALAPLLPEAVSGRGFREAGESEAEVRNALPTVVFDEEHCDDGIKCLENYRKIWDQDSLARALHIKGYFLNPHFWQAMEEAELYTQGMHKAWIEKQRCDFRPGGRFAVGTPCNGDVVGHHIRTATNAGQGTKPPDWYLLPVCHAHHDHTHRHATREDREAHLHRAVSLTAMQMKHAMKEWMGRSSLSGITLAQLRGFEATIRFGGMQGVSA